MSVLTGEAVDRCLQQDGAIAQALDRSTILLSARFFLLTEPHQSLVVGHELAHTLQLARGGKDDEEFLEEEAWRAAAAAMAGRRYKVTGSARSPLSAHLLYEGGAANDFFARFPVLHIRGHKKIKIDKRIAISPLNLERLMDLMVVSRQKEYVIDVHGSPSGMTLNFSAGAKGSATAQGLRQIMVITPAADYIQKMGTKAGTSSDLVALKRIITALRKTSVRNLMKAKGQWRPKDPSSMDVGQAKTETSRLIDAVVDRVYQLNTSLTALAGGLSSHDKQTWLRRLIRKMRRVQALGIRKILILGCTIGAKKTTLDAYRHFFKAKRVCSPKLDGAFNSGVKPSIGRRNVLQLRKSRQGKILRFNVRAQGKTQQVVVQIERKSLVKHEADCAADSEAAVKAWLNAYIMRGASYSGGSFPLHFLSSKSGKTVYFPRQSGYARNIVCRS